MFVGHFAVAMIAKRAEPEVSLGTFALAAVFADLVCFGLLLFGIDRFITIPGVTFNRNIGFISWSHSLAMMIFWGIFLASGYYVLLESARAAWILFAVVVSHWVLDVISHRRDMELWPRGPAFGLGLWNSLPATILIESGFWTLAIVIYLRSTQPRTRFGLAVLWVGIALLTLIGLSSPGQGIDPDPLRASIGGFLVFGIFVAWAYWADHLRSTAA